MDTGNFASPARLPAESITLGERHQVLAIGPGAQQQLLTSAGALQLRAGHLHAPGQTLRLQQGLAHAGRGQPVAMALSRPGRSPLTLRIERAPLALLPAALLLTLRDPDQALPDARLLQTLLGLTAAEARVAVMLCEGDGPTDIAVRLGVQPNTVKTHVRRLLAKSGTQRQSAFVSLVLRSAAVPTLPRPAPCDAAGAPAAAAPVRPGHGDTDTDTVRTGGRLPIRAHPVPAA